MGTGEIFEIELEDQVQVFNVKSEKGERNKRGQRFRR